jgi:glc operon protein GlcG
MNTFERTILAATVLLGLCAGAVHAAVATDKKTLTLDGANAVIAAAKAEAKRLNAPGGVIAVVDEGGNLIAVQRLDNTFAAGATISIGKARTAALFKKPTRFFEEIIKSGRTPMVALNDFTPLIGGIPIVADGQVVGAVGVSGAASADQDEQLALAGAAALNATAVAASAGAVSYFETTKVAESFARGTPLYESGSVNYAVHTSRREAAGQPEVHLAETDIIRVVSGEATFVTGGTVVDPRVTAPGEVRGASIERGETRRIRSGDVIVVPAGTPHWFKEVSGPVEYFVVKVESNA